MANQDARFLCETHNTTYATELGLLKHLDKSEEKSRVPCRIKYLYGGRWCDFETPARDFITTSCAAVKRQRGRDFPPSDFVSVVSSSSSTLAQHTDRNVCSEDPERKRIHKPDSLQRILKSSAVFGFDPVRVPVDSMLLEDVQVGECPPGTDDGVKCMEHDETVDAKEAKKHRPPRIPRNAVVAAAAAATASLDFINTMIEDDDEGEGEVKLSRRSIYPIPNEVLDAAKRPLRLPSQASTGIQLWQLLRLKHRHNFDESTTDDTWQTLVDGADHLISRRIREIETEILVITGWADEGHTVRSIIGYLRLLFAIPRIENAILTAPEAAPEVVREFADSPAFRAWQIRASEIHQMHPERAGKEMYAIAYGFFTDKHSWTAKQSGRTLFVDIMNMQRSVRTLQWIRYLAAELGPHSSDLYTAVDALHSEMAALAGGIELHTHTGETVWVYARLAGLSADSQERWRWASVNPPGGRTNYPCPVCLVSREELSTATTANLRSFPEARVAVRIARSLDEGDSARRAILDQVHLHESALENPLFDVPEVDNLFQLILPDNLHLVLFYFKVLVGALGESLSRDGLELIQKRLDAVHLMLPEGSRPSKLEVWRSWNGREARSFGLIAPYVLDGIALAQGKNEGRLWTLMATLVSMMYAPESTVDTAAALTAIAHEVEELLLATYRGKDDERRSQLNTHSASHIGDGVAWNGPAVIWDTETAESTQSKVASWSQKTHVNMLEYSLRNSSCWQGVIFSDLLNNVDCPEARELLERTRTNRLVSVNPRGRDRYFVTNDGIPLNPGTVVVQLRETTPQTRPPTKSSAFPARFYEYSVVRSVNPEQETVEVSLLRQPKKSLPMKPFPFVDTGEAMILRVNSIHRAVARLPTWNLLQSTFSESKTCVIPSRFLTHNR